MFKLLRQKQKRVVEFASITPKKAPIKRVSKIKCVPRIIYDFFFYGGKNSTGNFLAIGFSTLDLIVQLIKSCGSGAATFRTKQVERYPLPKEKELHNEGRRSYDYCFDFSSGLHEIKW